MAELTDKMARKRAKLLTAFGEGLSVAAAAKRAGVGRSTAYEWRSADADFAKAWDEAIEAGTDVLEDEAVRRAVEGTDEPVFYQGMVCGAVRRYSDTLLIFMLKARRPEKFKDRPVRLNLPAIKTARDVLVAHAAAIQAMAAGQITPGEAATVVNVLEAKRKAIETVEIEARLSKLEQAGERR
jgi:AcrR family transcriptional regulator